MTRAVVVACTIPVLIAIVASGGMGSSSAQGRKDDPYVEAIASYVRGETSQALSRARGAVLLHTEAWIAGGEPAARAPSSLHVDCARAIVRKLHEAARREPAADDVPFVRDWYLLVTAHLHRHAAVGPSRALLHEARELFPDDPAILLSSGSVHEMVTFASGGVLASYDASRRRLLEHVDRRRELQEAARFLRRSVQRAPDLVVGRLRLGRVLHQLEQLDAAATELEAARAQVDQPVLRYLTNVFLGLVESARGRGASAAERFTEAAREIPDGQSVLLGMGELAYTEGRTEEAADIVRRMLSAGKSREQMGGDPWSAYILGDAWHFEPRLHALRGMVRR